MCGRYTNRYTWAEIHGQLNFFTSWEAPADDPPPRYNLAPTQQAPIVIAKGESGGEGCMARWDFVPFFFKQPLEAKKWTSINAREEEIASKPAYRSAFRTQRCLVPNDGFFEWKKEGDEKQPYWFKPTDTDVAFFAGVWDDWKGVHKGQAVAFTSFAILICAPNTLVAPIHNRMPVIIRPEDARAWLFGTPAEALKLAGPYPSQMMRKTPVSKLLGNVRNDYPDLLKAA